MDRPVLVRYVEYIGGLLHGDLGYSLHFKTPVSDIIFDRLGNTLILAAISFAIIVPLSILLGVIAGMREAVLHRPEHSDSRHVLHVRSGVRDRASSC